MFRPRIIPVLLLDGQGLVKTVRFGKPRYIGDPINAVRIFNDLQVDELIFLDIRATQEDRSLSIELVKQLGDEAFMPFAVGGGIKNIEQVGALLKAGAEKVVVNSAATENIDFIKEIAFSYGNQSVVGSVDVKKGLFGKLNVYSRGGNVKTPLDLTEYLHRLVDSGVGEIMINSIDRDGTMAGYDLDLVKTVTDQVSVPVIACGGAGSVDDLVKVYVATGVSAIAAGSLFIYHGPRNAVLINYPDKDQINKIIYR